MCYDVGHVFLGILTFDLYFKVLQISFFGRWWMMTRKVEKVCEKSKRTRK
jgi:hypothetical protein